MSSSTVRYLPGLGGRLESSSANLEGLTSAPTACDLTPPNGNAYAPSLSDEVLMEHICQGDQAALASLFRRYAVWSVGWPCGSSKIHPKPRIFFRTSSY